MLSGKYVFNSAVRKMGWMHIQRCFTLPKYFSSVYLDRSCHVGFHSRATQLINNVYVTGVEHMKEGINNYSIKRGSFFVLYVPKGRTRIPLETCSCVAINRLRSGLFHSI